jgi:flagellar hook-associated protein 2
MAMQINVNRLFENPPTTTNATPSAEDYYNITNPQITVSVNSAGDGIRFTAKDGSRVSLGYATAPATVSLTKNDGESTENYNNRVKQAEEDAHRATGLGVLGFNDKQSNKVDIYSSIADLETQLKGSFVPYGTDTNGNQYVYYDAVYNQTRELTSSNFSFIINDVRFTIDKDESLYSVMSKINSSTAGVTLSYSEVTDKFTLTSKQQGMGENIVMGDTNRNLLAALGLQNTDIQVGTKDKTNSVVTFPVDNNNDLIPVSNDNATTTYGQNAIAYIDGQKIERASNEFTVNGVAYSLKELYANNGWAPQTDNNGNVTNATSGTAVTLAADVTDLKENIKNFVTDYNALVDLLHGMTNEEAYSDYEPLTEEQRAAMSESQIKLWEEKAKSGMLLNDSTVNKILSSMREAFLTTSDGFGLYSMGITYGGWQENGKLKITDEAQLQSALEARPDQVRDFFTNASKGVATKLDTVIDNAVRTTGGEGYRGSLIEIAGWPSTLSETENTLYTQMLNHNKRITALKEQLEKEESRLWTQFSAMEEALSKLNEQNNLITQYFGQKSS